MKIAIIHDWLITFRGGEHVLETLLEIYPNADVYTLFLKGKEIPHNLRKNVKKTSFLQRAPFISKAYRYYLPLMPMAIELFDLSGYDIVISTSHAVAKGVLIHPGTIHISYIHSPMRYIWDRYHDYFGNTSGLKGILMDLVFSYLRVWDTVSAARVDHFIANSTIVKNRIEKYYEREAEIIHPPVNVTVFKTNKTVKKEDYYFMLSAFVPYKKVEIGIKAFMTNNKNLIVAGSGPGYKELKKLCQGHDNIKIVLKPTNEKIVKLYQEAKGFIFPGFEDFGITMVEAIASGTPVIAYDRGGARDIVVEGKTGIFFSEQTVLSLNRAVEKAERTNWDRAYLMKYSERFSKEIFKRRFKKFVDEKINKSL